MCNGQFQPSSVSEALRMLDSSLDYLNAADAASLPSAVQAEALRALERADAKRTAAQARMLAAFAGQAAYEADGQGSAGAWLRWQTRVTRGAAAGAVGWARRLAAHPAVDAALAVGLIGGLTRERGQHPRLGSGPLGISAFQRPQRLGLDGGG